MNIRRFVAANSRLALREVREALGGDAVILANRPIEGGVEILAAASGDLSRMTEPLAPASLKERAAPATLTPAPAKAAGLADRSADRAHPSANCLAAG
jgi:flagellar biosynthesis protein FlhF